MKKNAMPQKMCLRNKNNECDGTLQYYHEGNNANDLYFCNRCYQIAEWDGQTAVHIGGEAYPHRDKKADVHSVSMTIDPLCQILIDFYADIHEENPNGETHLVNYGMWADKIGSLYDCACHEPLKEGILHSKYHCQGEKYGTLRAGKNKETPHLKLSEIPEFIP